jgi:hypothetical protein
MAEPVFTAIKSLVRVGGGRGFVVETRLGGFHHTGRLVITAAHCLPNNDGWDNALPDLLGKLGDEPSIAAQCIFIDPVADVAVLCTPDTQAEELAADAEAYEALIEAATPLKIGRAIPWETPMPVSLIALDGHEITGVADHCGMSLGITKMSDPTVKGMSGSPVIDRQGDAIGIVNLYAGGESVAASLLANLPGWLLVALGAAGAIGREALYARDYFRAQMLRHAIASGKLKMPKRDHG